MDGSRPAVAQKSRPGGWRAGCEFFFSYRLLKGISMTAQQNSQALMLFDVSMADRTSALSAIDHCLNSRVDGIIATHRDDPVYQEYLKRIIRQGVNVVIVLNRGDIFLQCPHVLVDHEQGGFIATKYLIDKGHKRIAHLASRYEYSVGKEQFKGYKRALEEARIQYDERLVVEDAETTGFDGAKALLKLHELPDAVFSWSDRSAVHAHHIFKSAGVSIELTGFDNREFIQYLEEPFSSVDYPLEARCFLQARTEGF